METTRLTPLRIQLAAALIILAALFAAGISLLLLNKFEDRLNESLRHRLADITTLAALQQDGDAFAQVGQEGDPYFTKIRDQNLKIKASDPELRFVYTMRKDSQGRIYFVVDAGHPGDEGYSPFGLIYQKPGPALAANFDSMTGTVLEPDFYTDEYGSFLSGYAPIFSSDGKRVGVIGVDITANTILRQQATYRWQIAILYLITMALLIPIGFLFANYLAQPIIRLRDMTDKISKGKFDTKISELPRIRELAELTLDLNAMSSNLKELITDLEQRVEDRTAGLARKTEQMRAASYIVRQTADTQDLASILETVVKLIADQFGYYHAGIFLINEIGDEAVLLAASSDGGKQLVKRGFSVKVDFQTVVGSAASQKKARIALNIGPDAVFFNNPDLPLTRSEIALPLIIRSKVLGVLDIQTDQPGAFTAEDTDVLQTLADQVSVALDNARLLAETQAALVQLEAVSNIRIRDAWTHELQERPRAFTYTPLGIRAEASSSMNGESLEVPITLRGQKIGTITLNRKDNSKWGKLDEALVNEVATQVGLAADNLRLLEDAQQRARQEKTIGELATRFSQALDIDSLLQAAAREMGQLPDVAEVSVYIGQLPMQAPPKRRKRPVG